MITNSWFESIAKRLLHLLSPLKRNVVSKLFVASLFFSIQGISNATIDFAKTYSAKVVSVDTPFSATYNLTFQGFSPAIASFSDTYNSSFTLSATPSPINCPQWNNISVQFTEHTLSFSSLLVPFNSGDTCSFKVGLTSSVPGVYTSNNTVPAPVPGYFSNTNPSLVVLYPPSVILNFDQDQSKVNEIHKLTVYLENKNSGLANFINGQLKLMLTEGLVFTAGLVENTCGGPTINPPVGGANITLTNLNIPPPGCTISLPVTSPTEGAKEACVEVGGFQAYPELLSSDDGPITDPMTNPVMAEIFLTVGNKPTFATTNLDPATIGKNYTFQVVAVGSQPLSYQGADFPPSLSISNTGQINGIPSISGTFKVIITLNNPLGQASKTFDLVVNNVPPKITSNPPSDGTLGNSYSYQVVAEGTPPFVFTANNLPPGLVLDAASGKITGTPTQLGTFTGILTVANGTLPNAEQPFTIKIQSTRLAPTIISAPPSNGIVGINYVYTVAALGSTPLLYQAAGLPSGLNINANSGVIVGVPLAVGTYSGTIAVSNGTAPDAIQNFTIVIEPIAPTTTAPTITSPPPAEGTEGVAYTYQVVATGTQPIQYSAMGLPPGITIDSNNGLVAGTPKQVGTFPGEITVANQINPAAKQAFTLVIKGRPVAIENNVLPDGNIGQNYSYSFLATGTPPLVYTAQGLPTGLSINRNTGLISGIPADPGNYEVEFRVQNGYGPDAVRRFTITISGAPLFFTSPSPSSGQVGLPYEHQFRTNSTDRVTYALEAASNLPPGLSLDSLTGRIFGIPNQSGTFTATVRASSDKLSATQTFTINIAGSSLQITSDPPPNGVEGLPYQHTINVIGIPPIAIDISGLPPGLRLENNPPRIVGTPLQAGIYNGVISASNGSTASTEQRFSVTITSGAPIITSINQLQGLILAPFSFALQAQGMPPLRFSGENLPPGLLLDSNTGIISGIPTQAGVFQSLVRVSNRFEPTAVQRLTIIIHPQLANVQLSASPSPAVYGQQITLQAVVHTAFGTPEGTLLFKDGTNTVGQTNLQGGIATLKVPSLRIGVHQLIAEYSGNPVQALPGAKSPAVSLFISKGILLPSKIKVALTQDPTTFSLPGEALSSLVKISATVSTDHLQVQPTGLVAFYTNDTLLGTAALQNGDASFIINRNLSTNVRLTAQYMGNNIFQKSPTQAINMPALSSDASPLSAHTQKIPSRTGVGNIIINLQGPTTCQLTNAQPAPEVARLASSTNLPSNSYFADNLVSYGLVGCPLGSTVVVSMIYPNTLPANTQYWQFGSTPEQPTPHWYRLPASVNENAITFNITEGGWGDDDTLPNGQIQGIGGIISLPIDHPEPKKTP